MRGMAFGKPVLIVGERGFSAPFTPETAASFYYRGMYGVGEGEPGNSRLVEDIRLLAEHPGRLPALGEFSREFVVDHFALEKVGAKLERFLCMAADQVPRLHVAAADGLRTAAVWMRERRFLPPHWNAKMKEFLSMGGKSGFP